MIHLLTIKIKNVYIKNISNMSRHQLMKLCGLLSYRLYSSLVISSDNIFLL